MKLYLYIADHEDFLAGEYNWAFRVRTDREKTEKFSPEFIYVTEIEIANDIDITDVTQAAVTAIDNEITETRARLQGKVNELETRKANLLSLEHKTEIPA